MKFTTSILKHFSRLSFWLQVVQIVSKDCSIKSTLNYQLLKILMEMLLICKCSVILPLKQLQIISQVRISLAKVDMDLFTKVLFGNPSIVYCFMCMEILKCRVQILFDRKKKGNKCPLVSNHGNQRDRISWVRNQFVFSSLYQKVSDVPI